MTRAGSVASRDQYDLVIAGGGILGAALAREAALRGIRLLLVEKADYAAGASSNNLKIIHGGLRYLQSGDITRARRSAREQSGLFALAPGLFRRLGFVVPTGHGLYRGRMAYRFGLGFYHQVVRCGLPGFGDDRPAYGLINRDELEELVPQASYGHCSGGARWEDVQIPEPARLVLGFIRDARRAGADCLNYTEVVRCNIADGSLQSISILDHRTGRQSTVNCSLLVDATGPGLPGMLPDSGGEVEWCKAVNLHLDLDPDEVAYGINPGLTDAGNGPDGRFLFVTPWRSGSTAGTWYFGINAGSPRGVTTEEVQYCLAELGSALKEPPRPDQVMFAESGLLPMSPGTGKPEDRLLEKEFTLGAEDHGITGYLRAVGVKYTTARAFAEHIIANEIDPLPGPSEASNRPTIEGATVAAQSVSQERLAGLTNDHIAEELDRRYGDALPELVSRLDTSPELASLVPGTSVPLCEVEYAIDVEQADSAADVLFRRTAAALPGNVPQETSDFILDYLGEKLQWDGQRRVREAGALQWNGITATDRVD